MSNERKSGSGLWFRSVTRIFPFDAGHRILGHESKCKNLHGHGYQAYVTVEAPELDPLGRIVDFGEIKSVIGEWIDKNWDHNIILHQDDPLAILYHHKRVCIQDEGPPVYGYDVFGGKAPFVMNCNPTAENMAKILFTEASDLLADNLKITNIRLYETQKCFADVSFRELAS